MLAGLAFLPLVAPIGVAYHYVRSNIDGSLPENIVMFQTGRTTMEIFKYVEPGTRSALVKCEMEPDGRSPKHLESWVLEGKTRRLLARLDNDADGGYATVWVAPSDQPAEPVRMESKRWHIFNMDLASLVMDLQNQPANRAARFRFIEPNTRGFTPAMEDKGEFVATPVPRRNAKRGVPCQRWMIRRGDKFGSIWLAQRGGYLVEATIPIPNHDGYRDFKMVLTGSKPMTEPQWDSYVRATVAGRHKAAWTTAR